jgi:hypothetical protein
LHLRIARWLANRWAAGDRELLLMAFRNSGKSTIVGLFAAWLLLQDSNTRILALAAEFALAKKMVRNVKRVIERHPCTQHLKPGRADQWAADQFTINRNAELRDPSMLAKGIGANVTGLRADIVICDDVEVPNTCDTAAKRAELRARLHDIEYVLIPGGLQLFVGTPHNYYSIYAAEPRGEIGEEHAFLDGFRRLELPLLDAKGNSLCQPASNIGFFVLLCAQLLAEVEGRVFSYAAAMTRLRRRLKPARPYMERLMTFNRLICPSTGPVLQGSVRAACTAARS